MSLIDKIIAYLCPKRADDAPVDVAAVLDARAAEHDQKLDWRTSVVDLLKTLDIPSDADNRRQLAEELGYRGDWHDSADMNTWLHRQIMQRVADNGGNVPEELK